MQLGLNTAAAFTNFFPTIVATLGYGRTETLLLSAPPYVFAAILGISNSWHSDKTRERWLHILWPQVFASVGFIISAVTLNTAARYTATFMMMSICKKSSLNTRPIPDCIPPPFPKSYSASNPTDNRPLKMAHSDAFSAGYPRHCLVLLPSVPSLMPSSMPDQTWPRSTPRTSTPVLRVRSTGKPISPMWPSPQCALFSPPLCTFISDGEMSSCKGQVMRTSLTRVSRVERESWLSRRSGIAIRITGTLCDWRVQMVH